MSPAIKEGYVEDRGEGAGSNPGSWSPVGFMGEGDSASPIPAGPAGRAPQGTKTPGPSNPGPLRPPPAPPQCQPVTLVWSQYLGPGGQKGWLQGRG